jgi:flagellar biosynthesis regulator FlaF
VKKMAGLDKPTARIPVLGRDNWSTWKEKFKALIVYKSLYVAIESPDSVEGRKASDQARSLMIMHTEDASVKLFAGADMAEKAWRKLHENFEKTSNARVVQLRKKLTSLTLMLGKSIAEHVGEFREIKMDLETGQPFPS